MDNLLDKILKGIFARGNFVYKDDKETDNLEIKNSLSCSFIKLKIQMFCNYIAKKKKEMATHSSILAWRIPGTAEPGRLPSMGSHRVGHD